jgi:hypothetical protein
VYDVDWRFGRFVAVGGIGFDIPAIWTSTDGMSWTALDEPSVPNGMDVFEVDAGGVGWAMAAEPRDGSARIGWFSTDAMCWVELPPGVAGTKIVVGDQGVMSVTAEPAEVWFGSASDTPSTGAACR